MENDNIKVGSKWILTKPIYRFKRKIGSIWEVTSIRPNNTASESAVVLANFTTTIYYADTSKESLVYDFVPYNEITKVLYESADKAL